MGLLESLVTFEFAKDKIPKLVEGLLKIRGKREEELEKISKVFGDP